MRLNTPMAISSQHPVASLSAQGHQVLPIIEGWGTSGETSFTLQPCFIHISSPISLAPNWPPSLLSNLLCSPTSLCSHLISHLLCSSPTSFTHLQPPLLLSDLLCSPISLCYHLISHLLHSSPTSFAPLQPPLLSDLLCSFTPLWPPLLLSDLLHSPTSFAPQPHFTPISPPISFTQLWPPSLLHSFPTSLHSHLISNLLFSSPTSFTPCVTLQL